MSTALTTRGWRGRGIAGRAIVAVSLVIGVVAGWMVLSAALAVRGIATGFDFLWRPASFQISEALFAVTPSDPIVVTLAAGLANTLLVVLVASPLALAIGIVVGLLRASPSARVVRFAGIYVQPLRNTPVILQLFLWYGLLIRYLPAPRDAMELLPGVFLSSRGLAIPAVSLHTPFLDWPVLRGFNFIGGWTLSPELLALIGGLALFHGASLAEVVRAGIQAVPIGQGEAARALGTGRLKSLWLVVLPQARRLAVPAAASQLLILAKNSTLAVAIGYPDLVSVTNTVINQTGRAIEGTAIILSVFLVLNLSLGAVVERYNAFWAGRGMAASAETGRATTKMQHVSWLDAMLLVVVLAVSWPLLRWGIVDAVWTGTPADCRAANGACWALLAEKGRLMMFGAYPANEIIRPVVATTIFSGLIIWSLIDAGRHWRLIASGWALGTVAAIAIMGGGVFGLRIVSPLDWGGVPLTIGLAVLSFALALPLGMSLALARTSDRPGLRNAAVAAIEMLRSLPLVSLLFAVAVILPLLVPGEAPGGKLARCLLALTLLMAAYLAEVFRGGIQAIPTGELDAARALGLGYWRTQQLVIWPQVFRLCSAPLVNTFIGGFKDTSLVLVIGLLDVFAATKAALADPEWRLFSTEAYLVLAAIYFTVCYAMSRYAARLERESGSRAASKPINVIR
ncbi:ABC transporter permease subunit [Bradyrhizobium arachidis]|uniref:ABC transporter permease subunit n=1 Tax=Bradyrhizobium arachidis TaxID=858423 RepID=A0AAE7NL88_9BRAD|nr:ABC transporter permease subunit [Bradyrhizobium arachidis]QOZ67341.1 ABC transporter permease subunit [Bradyrhizobium arachidis]SFU80240.1 amino acid ABC transporter membrane protein 1, PAAT family [Bradyrhizobium arachidis]